MFGRSSFLCTITTNKSIMNKGYPVKEFTILNTTHLALAELERESKKAGNTEQEPPENKDMVAFYTWEKIIKLCKEDIKLFIIIFLEHELEIKL